MNPHPNQNEQNKTNPILGNRCLIGSRTNHEPRSTKHRFDAAGRREDLP
jgi:hypothetical protein